MIKTLTHSRAQAAEGLYLVFVIPLLIESGRWRNRFDRICVVDCEPETQIARVQARSGLTTEVIERIMSAQASRQERLAAADDIINNDAQTDVILLEARTRAVHETWLRMAGQHQK
jgi:dephospho-CoA kinase